MPDWTYTVSVRSLCEFTAKRGDLDRRFTPSATALEGQAGQMAVYAGRSRRQLERLFKEQLGTTPQRYYMALRVTEARRLLQHTELSQVEVLVACGFVSPSHFSKCYSSYFGYRPSKEKRLVK